MAELDCRMIRNLVGFGRVLETHVNTFDWLIGNISKAIFLRSPLRNQD